MENPLEAAITKYDEHGLTWLNNGVDLKEFSKKRRKLLNNFYKLEKNLELTKEGCRILSEFYANHNLYTIAAKYARKAGLNEEADEYATYEDLGTIFRNLNPHISRC